MLVGWLKGIESQRQHDDREHPGSHRLSRVKPYKIVTQTGVENEKVLGPIQYIQKKP